MAPLVLIVFLLLALIAEILGTVGGFGSSVFFVPAASHFLNFQSVLAITAIFHVSSNLSKIAFFRKGIDKTLVINLGVPAVMAVILGAWLSQYIDNIWLETLLYVFLIGLSLVFLIFNQLEVKPTRINSILGGSLSGFLAGLIGTGGAVRGITMAAFNLPKEIFIATSALIDLGIDLSRSAVYIGNGYMMSSDWYLIPLLLVVSVLGTWIGKRILQRIPQERFRMIVLVLILGIGVVSLIRLSIQQA